MLQAVAASQALEAVGLPEARLSMAQAIIAICESPKSNSVVMALDQSVADAEKGGFGPVPIHLRDTHYAGHERLGSGAEYKYRLFSRPLGQAGIHAAGGEGPPLLHSLATRGRN